MTNVAKINRHAELDYVDQSTGSNVMEFVLTDGRRIDVDQNRVLDFIEAIGLNISTEGHGMVIDPNSTSVEVETDPNKYLDDNFEYVVHLYYKSVLSTTIREAFSFMQGYASSVIRQGKTLTKTRISKMMGHVHSEYGINMRTA